jgi:urease accessory protein
MGTYVRGKGLAMLTAEAVGPRGATKLTRVAHRNPMRLLPMRPAEAERAGSAQCALGSYGGGVLGGDTLELRLRCGAGAALTLTTQASTKVYRAKRDGRASAQVV